MNVLGLDSDSIYLFDDNGELERPIRCLSAQEVETLKRANNILHEFQYYNRRMLEIEQNHSDYQETFTKFANMVRETSFFSKHDSTVNEIFVNVNRTFINFVTSLKVFVDHIEIRLKRKYGENSDKFKEFRHFITSTYDAHFCYRLLINIRDYAIHNNYPIHITVDKELNKINNDFDYKLFAKFNKRELLSDQKFKKKMGKDVAHYANEIPVEFVMLEIRKNIQDLFDIVLKIEKQYFVDQANIIVGFVNENKNGLKTSFGKLIHSYGTRYKFETTSLPTTIIADLRANFIALEEKQANSKPQ
jgi:hypothetical protein